MWQTAQNAPNDGHVTLLITTPAGDGFPLTSQITRDKPATRPEWPDPEYADSRRVPPNDARSVLGAGAQNQRHGVWVVGHEDYRPQPGITILRLPEHEAREGDNCTKGTLVHQIPLPTLNWSATAKSVVCVRPSFWEGGVLGAGFPYVAPTP
jgi:hypothetical protein